jgi:3-oxoacyl-[acyl-carrier protein] reductase
MTPAPDAPAPDTAAYIPPMTSPRSILITGANGVLGQGIARHFLQHEPSCIVFLGIRSGRAQADALAAEHPQRAFVLSLDVTQEQDWAAAMQHMEAHSTAHGAGFTVLINNAGFHDDALLATMTTAQWSSVITGNLHSVFLGCHSAIPLMMGQRVGRIVNIASLSALHPPAGQTNYAAAKAGVLALTQSLAKETARLGITVNAIAPAHIEGALPASWTPEQAKAARMAIPMRRFARADEVAAAAFFLASPQASYITGAVLKMDGGLV